MDLTQAAQVMLPPFVLCLLMVGMLSYLGLHVIKREIIFVDLALAQIAALGALIGFLLGIPLNTHASYWFSMALTAIAAAVFTLTRTRESRLPQEAVIGLVYAIAAAAAIIFMDKAPHGAQHIKDILTGSILWVQWKTVGLVAVVYTAVGVFHFAFRRPFLLISEDVEAARAQGLRVGFWDFLFYLSFGFVITASVGTAGVLLVFVFLVAPAVMAVLVTDRLLYQLMFGWIVGLLVTITGLAVSLAADLSSGPLVISAYAVALVLVAAIVHIVRAPDRGRALRNTSCIAAGFVVCFGILLLFGRAIGASYHGHTHSTQAIEHHHDEAAVDTAEAASDSFAIRFEASDDPAERCDMVCEALAADSESGIELAADYLQDDPPLFFAQTVVESLDALLPIPSGYDVEQSFDAPANQAAINRAREELVSH
ncbi:MAG: metal ABC transporter permease [Armatimonadetes bacterium]|nr:metal ABC transporter permease [Armatimonadota bacterium]